MSQQTYNDLIDAAKNTNAIQDDTDKLVESRYAAVIASAKRARQLIDGADPVLPNADGRKPLAIAVEELARNLVTIKRGSEVDDDPKIAARENPG
ncbi:MAG TPA: DNA-directed RNA polymerase subunit omega, partial [Oribacterium sp.]|nr:DNA-directed RNA polymerase subunit omega [Oribacterium sp.]